MSHTKSTDTTEALMLLADSLDLNVQIQTRDERASTRFAASLENVEHHFLACGDADTPKSALIAAWTDYDRQCRNRGRKLELTYWQSLLPLDESVAQRSGPLPSREWIRRAISAQERKLPEQEVCSLYAAHSAAVQYEQHPEECTLSAALEAQQEALNLCRMGRLNPALSSGELP